MDPAGSPTSVTVEGTIRRANGDIVELGPIAYWHRNPVKHALGQRNVRGSGIVKALLRREPKIRQEDR